MYATTQRHGTCYDNDVSPKQGAYTCSVKADLLDSPDERRFFWSFLPVDCLLSCLSVISISAAGGGANVPGFST